MRICLAIAAILVVAAGCDSNVNKASRDTPAASGSPRVERCTQRVLRRVEGEATAQTRRYVETAYCKPFEKRGWVHDDGTLSIAAYLDASSRTCASGGPGQPARTVPCEELDQGGPRVLDCALLHLVPSSEVRKYVEGLKQRDEVTCDDGTPLANLGAG